MDVNHPCRKYSPQNTLFFFFYRLNLSSSLAPSMELIVGLHKHLHKHKGNGRRTGVGLLFSVTGGSQDASAVLRRPAGGEQGCRDSQVPFPVGLPLLRMLGLAKYSVLLKHPMAIVSPCLRDHSHLTLLRSQTDPALFLKTN